MRKAWMVMPNVRRIAVPASAKSSRMMKLVIVARMAICAPLAARHSGGQRQEQRRQSGRINGDEERHKGGRDILHRPASIRDAEATLARSHDRAARSALAAEKLAVEGVAEHRREILFARRS